MKSQKEIVVLQVFVESKVCKMCNIEHPLSFYHRRKSSSDGFRHECKSCISIYHRQRRNGPKRDEILQKKKEYAQNNPEVKRNSWYKHKYGITLEDYNSMLKLQKGGCAICKSEVPLSTQHKHLYVDHNHTTGKVRGILCHPCNRTIGSALEDLGRLKGCIDYLEKQGGICGI